MRHILLSTLLLSSCGEGEQSIPLEAPVLFDRDHVIEVDIQLRPDDWDALRFEGRSLSQVMAGCDDADFSYTYFPATVAVDGVEMELVAVRKKGFLGSLSVNRPSLKLNLGKYVEHTLDGFKRITLNNDKQDPSHTHQCMSYELFRKAGLVAPRCSFAHLYVNGMDLGIYSHVEAIKKPFLAQHFSSDEGNLYEAAARADFHPALVEKYERKTNETSETGGPPDRSDLDRVAQALEASDTELYDALSEVIAIDQFLSFWAMEVLTGHWDSYSGNRNNHYIYRDPATDRFHFIPWGTDGAFSEHAFLDGLPASVYAWGAIANRLYAYPPTRELYRQRLAELLGSVWDEDELVGEVDRIGALTSADSGALETQRSFIRQHGAAIQSALDGAAPEWPYPLVIETHECQELSPISGTFGATWSNGGFQPNASSSLDFALGEMTPSMQSYFTSAAIDSELEGRPTVKVFGSTDLTTGFAVILVVAEPQFAIGEVPWHGFESFGVLAYSEANAPTVLGFIGDGSIVFDEAGMSYGDAVSGSFTGAFVDPL